VAAVAATGAIAAIAAMTAALAVIRLRMVFPFSYSFVNSAL
jgi:hypothetical protein